MTSQRNKKRALFFTFEVHQAHRSALHLDGLIIRFVAFQLGTGSAFVADKSLLRFQYQHWSMKKKTISFLSQDLLLNDTLEKKKNQPVDQIKEKLARFLGRLSVGVEMARFLGSHKFAIVGTESDRTIRLPLHLEQGV